MAHRHGGQAEPEGPLDGSLPEEGGDRGSEQIARALPDLSEAEETWGTTADVTILLIDCRRVARAAMAVAGRERP